MCSCEEFSLGVFDCIRFIHHQRSRKRVPLANSGEWESKQAPSALLVDIPPENLSYPHATGLLCTFLLAVDSLRHIPGKKITRF